MVTSLQAKSLLLLLVMLLFLITGTVSCASVNTHLVVGGKLDTEAQILTKIYVLLLRHVGLDVIERAKLGTNKDVFAAISSGQIDLYPEFTADGLAKLNLSKTRDQQHDYAAIKRGYEANYHITWLNPAPLNDTYGICTLKTTANDLHVTKISQLAPLVSRLVIATPPDGLSDPNVLPGLQGTYGFSFPRSNILTTTDTTAEAKTFQAVIQGQAQLNICYTTSPLISQDNFVLLLDDLNSFPVYDLAPIVRDDALARVPEIADILNKLAPKLTTDVSVMLQAQVTSGFSVETVATKWLQSQGLL
ncbi:MAG TPA: glycine betaine ABC transporter substrate-binding protein [Ktedonobacteraceae bacterium]